MHITVLQVKSEALPSKNFVKGKLYIYCMAEAVVFVIQSQYISHFYLNNNNLYFANNKVV